MVWPAAVNEVGFAAFTNVKASIAYSAEELTGAGEVWLIVPVPFAIAVLVKVPLEAAVAESAQVAKKSELVGPATASVNGMVTPTPSPLVQLLIVAGGSVMLVTLNGSLPSFSTVI